MNGSCMTIGACTTNYSSAWTLEDKDSIKLMGRTQEGVEFVWMKISKELLKKPEPFVATEIVKDGK